MKLVIKVDSLAENKALGRARDVGREASATGNAARRRPTTTAAVSLLKNNLVTRRYVKTSN